MLIAIFYRAKVTTNTSYYCILLGGVLFGISDSVLGISFLSKTGTKYHELVVMITYYLA